MNKIEMGMTYRSILDNFTGVVVGRVKCVSGCDEVLLLKDEDGDRVTRWATENIIEYIDNGIFDEFEKKNLPKFSDIANAKYGFNDVLKDSVTGFKGTVVSIRLTISGGIDYGLTPKYSKGDSELIILSIPESRCELVESAKDTKENSSKRKGGIMKFDKKSNLLIK